MLYMSNDRKRVFKTEQECCEYEQEMIKKEKIKMDRQNRLDSINKKYEDLQKDISEYRKDYGIRLEEYFTPFQEFVSLLCR